MFKKVLGFVAQNGRVISAFTIGIPFIACCGANTDRGKRIRLQIKFGGPIATLSLKEVPDLSLKEVEDAVRFELCEGIDLLSGVKIVWSEAGSGKSATVKNAINKLIAEGKIAGCIYMKPTMNQSEKASDWFYRSISDIFGPILHLHINLSSLLGYARTSPYALVIDEFEGSDQELARYEMLIRRLSHDAYNCKSYMVFVITSDASNAKTISTWGHSYRVSFLMHCEP